MSQHPTASAALLVSPVRRAILDALPETRTDGATPSEPVDLTAPQVADRLGIHPSTARFHLERLVAAGLVTEDFRPNGSGVPTARYAARPAAAAPPEPYERAYRLLAELLTDVVASQAVGLTPEEAGARWARDHASVMVTDAEMPQGRGPARTPTQWLTSVGHVVDLLEGWGYDASVETEHAGTSTVLKLTSCPFVDLATAHAQVVCATHRGLLCGALDVLGESGAGVDLDPFVTADLCTARLTPGAELVPPQVPSGA